MQLATATTAPHHRARRVLDLLIVGVSSPLWVPVLTATLVVARITQGPSALFVQERIGLGGSKFRMFKVRTMIPDADDHLDEHGAPTRCRVTPLGRVLRRTSLDELPQLLNVLRGEMSVVGPRPVLPERLESIPSGAAHPRFHVPPGLTGAAQVAGRNSLPWSRRLALDMSWSQDPSPARYLRLLVATPAALVRPTVSPDRNPHEVDDLVVPREVRP